MNLKTLAKPFLPEIAPNLTPVSKILSFPTKTRMYSKYYVRVFIRKAVLVYLYQYSHPHLDPYAICNIKFEQSTISL